MDTETDFYGPSKDEIIARHRKKTRKVRKKGTKKRHDGEEYINLRHQRDL